jgi:hypothetical protein
MNRRITEADVLRIASMKPPCPQVPEDLDRSPKWISSDRMKKALV